ncbi:MAG: hypothetical protein ACLP1E_18230 [Acidimicrobiales bacterium]
MQVHEHAVVEQEPVKLGHLGARAVEPCHRLAGGTVAYELEEAEQLQRLGSDAHLDLTFLHVAQHGKPDDQAEQHTPRAFRRIGPKCSAILSRQLTGGCGPRCRLSRQQAEQVDEAEAVEYLA